MSNPIPLPRFYESIHFCIDGRFVRNVRVSTRLVQDTASTNLLLCFWGGFEEAR